MEIENPYNEDWNDWASIEQEDDPNFNYYIPKGTEAPTEEWHKANDEKWAKAPRLTLEELKEYERTNNK